MRKLVSRLALVALANCLFFDAESGRGQETPAGPATGCALHVWPSSGLRSIYNGWAHGSIVDGAVTGRDGYPTVPAKPLSPSDELELMSAAGLPSLLAKQGYQVVTHPDPLASRVIRTTPGRIDQTPSPCYAELMVDTVTFQQDIINGTKLRMLFRYRDFANTPTPQRVFSSWVETKLMMFPPKTPDVSDAATAEFRQAYTNNIRQFAALLTRPAVVRQ